MSAGEGWRSCELSIAAGEPTRQSSVVAHFEWAVRLHRGKGSRRNRPSQRLSEPPQISGAISYNAHT